MSDIFNNIFENLKAANASHKTMIEEGIKIGRRETWLEFSGLVREMCDMLDHLAPEIDDDCFDDRYEAEKLIASAKALLDETAQPAGREAALDEAWHLINAEGGVPSQGHIEDEAHCRAIGVALDIIEKLGGMDPLQRGRENND